MNALTLSRVFSIACISITLLPHLTSFSISKTSSFLKLPLLFSSSADLEWSSSVIPAGFDDAVERMNNAFHNELAACSSKGGNLLSLDLLTPGLNPKLEQKAILRQEYLFNLVISLFKVLDSFYSDTLFMFPSMGDAAGFQKYLFQTRTSLPSSITLTDLDKSRIEDRHQCILIINAKNYIGDPVLRTVQQITREFKQASLIFLNSDLSDKVTTGIKGRVERDSFRASIRPVYYFRNVVSISRPSLIPQELGAISYEPTTGWRIYAINSEDIFGSGSLNRFLEQAVFQRHPKDPTTVNPPRFLLVGQDYPSQPKREDIDAAISRSSFLVATAARKKELRDKERFASLKNSAQPVVIDTASAAFSVLIDRGSGPRAMLDAIEFLSAQARSKFVSLREISAASVAAAQVQFGPGAEQVMGIVDMSSGKTVGHGTAEGSTPSIMTSTDSISAVVAHAPPVSEMLELLRGTAGEGGSSAWSLQCEVAEDSQSGAVELLRSGAISQQWRIGPKDSVENICSLGPINLISYKGFVKACREVENAAMAVSSQATRRTSFTLNEVRMLGLFTLETMNDVTLEWIAVDAEKGIAISVETQDGLPKSYSIWRNR